MPLFFGKRNGDIQIMNKVIAGVAAVACMLAVAACDNTYTPSMHHQEAASTGSMLSGTETGVGPGNGTNSPSINSNAGGPGAYGTH